MTSKLKTCAKERLETNIDSPTAHKESSKIKKMAKSKSLAFIMGGFVLFFNVISITLTGYAKDEHGNFAFNIASCVVIGELGKFIISVIGFQKARRSDKNVKFTLEFSNFMKYALPGLFYAICNVGYYLVLKYISATIFQAFNNMKIIAIAIIFRTILTRRLKVIQWIALIFLTLGMVITTPKGSDSDQISDHEGLSEVATRNIMIGFGIMVILSLASSFAGVYNEFLLKKSDDHIFFQNAQLYFWGVQICMIEYMRSTSNEKYFFTGYTPLVWLIIITKICYGQAVSFALKYADNIVKVYANAMACITTSILDYLFFGTPLTIDLMVGSIIVGMSVVIYYSDHNILLKDDAFIFDCNVGKTFTQK